MPKPRVIMIAVGLVGVLVLAGLLVSMSGSDPVDVDVPADFEDGDFEDLRFAYPPDWEGPEIGEETPNGGRKAIYRGPLDDLGFNPGIQVSFLPAGGSGFDGFVDGSRDSIEVLRGDATITSDQEVEIPGAVEAVLIEADFRPDLASGEGVEARSLDLLALAEDGRRYRFVAFAAQDDDDFDPATAVASVELEGEG